MQRGCEPREQHRFEVAAPVADRSPAEPPRQRKRPHCPQLRPYSVAGPHVRVLLVTDPGGAEQERRHRGRRRRGRPAGPECPGRHVDADRPQRQEQVQRPAKRHIRPGHQTHCAGQDRGEALVVKETAATPHRGTETSWSAAACPARSCEVRRAAPSARCIELSFRYGSPIVSARRLTRFQQTAATTSSHGNHEAARPPASRGGRTAGRVISDARAGLASVTVTGSTVAGIARACVTRSEALAPGGRSPRRCCQPPVRRRSSPCRWRPRAP